MEYNNVNMLPISKLNHSSRPAPTKKSKKSKKTKTTRIDKSKIKNVKYKGTYTISKAFGTGDISSEYEYGLSDW